MTLPTSAKEQCRFIPSDYSEEARAVQETAASKLRGKKREKQLAEIAARFETAPVYLIATPTILERAKWRRAVVSVGARWHDDAAMIDCLKRGIAEVIEPERQDEILATVDSFAEANDDVTADLARDFEEVERAILSAFEPYAAMAADRAYWLEVAPILAAQQFLRGWENVDSAFERRNGLVSETALGGIPEAHVIEIGLEAISLMSPTEAEAKN